MWARYIPFYLCQRMRRLRQQRFLTLSQNKIKVVSDSPEVHLNVSKQLFLNFHFFHWLKLDLVKMAKLACDLLCQRMRRMRQHFASVCGACGSTLLVYAPHTLPNCLRRRRLRQQNHVKMSFCKRMLRMRQQIASVCGACGSNLLAQMAHTVENCKRMRRMRQQFASADGAYGSNLKKTGITFIFAVGQRRRRMRQHLASVCGCKLLAQTAHTVAICQRMQRMRQQFASVDGTYRSNLLAYTAQAVAKQCKIVCFASVDGAYGSKLLAYAAHAVALCQRRRRIRQQFASVDGACGS